MSSSTDTPDGSDSNRLRRRAHRGPSARYSRERERVHSGASTRDLVRLLVAEEYESKQARKLLQTALHRLEAETRRADNADARALDTAQRFRSLTDAVMAAQLEASRSKEELELYKLQLETAQKEIFRAQDILGAVEAQRDEAEAAAAKARNTARQINEEHLIHTAREEGRRLGFEEGLRRGRRIGYEDGRDIGYEDALRTSGRARTRDDRGERPGGFEDNNPDRGLHPDPLPAPSPLYPESIRIRTPSVASSAPRHGTATPGPARPPSVGTQTSARTRPLSEAWVPAADADSLRSGPAASVQTHSVTPAGIDTGRQSQNQHQGVSDTRPRRRSSPESLSSTATGLSQLNLISFPNPSLNTGRPPSAGRNISSSGSGRERGPLGALSVIREDASSPSRSVRSSINTNQAPAPPGDPVIPSVGILTRESDSRSDHSSQYSDPRKVEAWRRAGGNEVRWCSEHCPSVLL
jgi:hypothetical protein